jgi:hypothetical protein
MPQDVFISVQTVKRSPMIAAYIDASLRRNAKTTTVVLFICVVIFQAAFHMVRAVQVVPYERWDEIATFNNAHVLVGPAAVRAVASFGFSTA